PVELEGSLARFAADEGEAQERKGLRFAEPASLAVDRRKAAELNQAGLVRVKRQRKFPEPFAHCIKETTRVALMLEADGQIVCETNDDHVRTRPHTVHRTGKLQPCPQSALGIMLVRPRVAKINQHPRKSQG